ncbi:MAG: hypothetical protein EBY17_04315 [Acidobacteriia bacterium]|nr:hypothetical protein [Terriglobia bacterium]
MKTVIARLDSEATRDLAVLAEDLGWTSSRIIRTAIHLLAESRRVGLARKPKGLRKFNASIPGSGPSRKRRDQLGI